MALTKWPLASFLYALSAETVSRLHCCTTCVPIGVSLVVRGSGTASHIFPVLTQHSPSFDLRAIRVSVRSRSDIIHRFVRPSSPPPTKKGGSVGLCRSLSRRTPATTKPTTDQRPPEVELCEKHPSVCPPLHPDPPIFPRYCAASASQAGSLSDTSREIGSTPGPYRRKTCPSRPTTN